MADRMAVTGSNTTGVRSVWEDSAKDASSSLGVDGSREWYFLRERTLQLYRELQDVERRLQDAEANGRSVPLAEERLERLAAEWQVVDSLLDETERVPLDLALAGRLRRIQAARFANGAVGDNRHGYSQAFWEQETEYKVLTDLLRRWQEWKHQLTDEIAEI